MELNNLTAVSPIDGRYGKQTAVLSKYFSEFGLIRYRVQVEIEYFIALCKIPLPQLASIDSTLFDTLREVYTGFSESDAEKIKEIEKTTNHDVKAVEYFIKEKFDEIGLSTVKEFIHFGLTSQDINNTSIPLSLKEGVKDVMLPLIDKINESLTHYSALWDNVAMLAKTHGQPASPTRLGKEIQVFETRLASQLKYVTDIPYSAKFGGATGNLNAHKVTFPSIDWVAFANSFVNQNLGLSRSNPTTQIEHYDNLAAMFDALKRVNTILIDLSRDIWQYISMGYFTQKIKSGEIGSSAMPHKVNPIDFENAEGNLGIANALLEHLSAKLPISRLQRDLTDSTVLRNIGVPFGHMVIAYNSLLKGLGKIQLNETPIKADLEDNWAVVAEGIQNILRREAFPNPYEALKALTRKNEKVTEKSIQEFIDTLEVSETLKEELRKITPFNYTGY